MFKKISYFILMVLFFISCGGTPTKTTAEFHTNEPNNTIVIDREKQIETIKAQLGDRFREDIVISKDKRDLFVRAISSFGMSEEILNYDIREQEPVFKQVVAKNSDGGFFGMYSLSTKKFIYAYHNFYIIVGKYDVNQKVKVWDINLGEMYGDVYSSGFISLDADEKYLNVGKYKIDVSSNYLSPFNSVSCLDGSEMNNGVCE